MQLVEKHIINQNSEFYSECDDLCFKSKNLYNLALYTIRQEYINNKVSIVNNIYQLMKTSDPYKALPAKCSCSTLNALQNNFKSFFASLNDFKVTPSKYNGVPRLPKYLHKTEGRYFIGYTNQAISKKVFKKVHKIKLSQSNIEFYTKIENFQDINCVRIIPSNGYYTIEVVYTVKEKELIEDNGNYASIDLGLNNLAAVTSNIKGFKPFIISGRPLKSINQYYNKNLALYSSELEIKNKKKKSKKITNLTNKRTNKINDYLHKSSRLLVNELIKSDISKLVIGHNKEWKQEINIGSVNNQNFVQIPHSRFIDMLKYKCELAGITVITREESYTSKCSFLDSEAVCNHDVYMGKRKHRGLFISSSGKSINADLNGSYNILSKEIPNAFSNGIEGVGVHPVLRKLQG